MLTHQLTETEARVVALAQTFRSLRNHPHVVQWDADKLDASSRGASDGEKHVIRFILSVWNCWHKWKSGPFSVVEASTCWDEGNWEAFRAWANNPFNA